MSAELERLRSECCVCEKCGHVQAEPNWCHECGHRTTMPEWAKPLVEAFHERRDLREKLEEYAEHQSWRCGHPDRYPWDPDCPCGLTADLRALDIAQT